VLPALATHRAGLPWLLCGDLCAAGSGAACEIYMPGSGGAQAVPCRSRFRQGRQLGGQVRVPDDFRLTLANESATIGPGRGIGPLGKYNYKKKKRRPRFYLSS
jgi:hypothetical protein